MDIKICDLCGKQLNRQNTRSVYTVKRKIFTHFYKDNGGEKIEKVEVCDECMNRIIKGIKKAAKNDK